MNPEMEARVNSSLNQAVCDLSDWIDRHDKNDHIHYGCRWETRGDKIFHVCHEQKTEWEVK